ncbi:MAG TPA: Fe-S cluster assembly ATPase SufC [Acidimicrobiia bacterium]|jgi:Fe-S cluster assembly ATP-binding protein
MSTLHIDDLHATVAGLEILRGVSLEAASGEVHVVMGPNGCGKSTLAHTLMGRSDYTVTAGRVTLDDADLLALPTWQRARAGLFVAMQYPIEVPGVPVEELVAASQRAGSDPSSVDGLHERLATEATRLGIDDSFLVRGVNDEFSGGEQKRLETLQLALLQPKFAVLDEIDSGLDVDALGDVARRVQAMTGEDGLGVIAITHYARLLRDLRPDYIHVMMAGRIVGSGGPELAERVEAVGYEGLARELGVSELTVEKPAEQDPFADPTVATPAFMEKIRSAQ